MDHNEMFGDLFKAFVKAYPEKKKSACQAEAILFWNQLKTSEPKDKLPELVRSKIQQLEALALGRQGALMKFWGKAASAASPTPTVSQPRASPSEHGASGSGQSSRKGEAKIAQPSSASCLKRPVVGLTKTCAIARLFRSPSTTFLNITLMPFSSRLTRREEVPSTGSKDGCPR